jgi:hypothetical protein
MILFLMNYNNTNQPLINNSREYLFTKKFLSIHSEDRDIARFPLSSQFDIELPQEYMNVVKVQLVEWSFPSNYYTFSAVAKNLLMSFQISEPYDAAANGVTDELELAISAGLMAFKNSLFVLQIEEGFYNPIQMATELTNRFNQTITDYLNEYFISISLNPTLIDTFNNTTNGVPNYVNDSTAPVVGGYTEFVIVYNLISQKLYFGNRSSRFIIPSIITPITKDLVEKYFYLGCTIKRLPQYTDKILLFNLGFDVIPAETVTLTNQQYARVYYEDAANNNGIWLTPSVYAHPGCNVSYIIPKNQINFMGPSHFYLDIVELNNMDELNPYPTIASISEISTDTPPNRVNSAFCKISVNSTPISQWYDRDNTAFKLFNPPAERLRKLRIRVRYHDGTLVRFGTFAYSLTLEISMFTPQQMATLKSIYPYGI